MKLSYRLFVLTLCGLISFSVQAKEKDEERPLEVRGSKIVRVLWTQGLKGGSSKKRYSPETASFTMDAGVLYGGTHSGNVYAVSNQGKILWSKKTKGPVASQPTVDNGLVFVGNNEGYAMAFNSADGRLQWEEYIGGEILSSPYVSGDRVFFATTSREVYGLSRSDGRVLWSTAIKGFEKKFTKRGTSPVVGDGSSIYVGLADGQLVSLSQGSGQVQWTRLLSEESKSQFLDLDMPLALYQGALYASGYFGSLYKLSAATGATLWKKEVAGASDFVFDEGSLYTSTLEGGVAKIDLESGRRLWDVDLGPFTLSSPALINGHVVVISSIGKSYVLNAVNGKAEQSFQAPSSMNSLISAGDRAYYLSSAAQIVALGRFGK